MNLFQVKSKPGGVERISEFKKEGFIAIGWNQTGSLIGIDKEGIRQKLAYIGYQGQSLLTHLGTVNSFVHTMQAGDCVVVSEGEQVHIGIMDDYCWEARYNSIECSHMRTVDWKATVNKNELNKEVISLLRNGTSVTRFKYPIQLAELDKYIDPSYNKSTNEEITSIVTDQLEQTALVKKALDVAKELLDSDHEQVRLEAAREILRFLK